MIIPMTQIERVIQEGHAARRLLANPDFVEVLNAISDQHLNALVAAPPGDGPREARDHHHLMIHTLQELHDEIRGREAALAELEETQEGEEDLDDA